MFMRVNTKKFKLDLYFTENDDYILKYMLNSDSYSELITRKGKELIEERESFLKTKN